MLQNLAADIINCYAPGWHARRPSAPSTTISRLTSGPLRAQGVAFAPDDVTRLTIAYHAVLHQLSLVDREDGATLMVAKRIINLASQGEHDPERLVATTLETLGSLHTATDRSDASRAVELARYFKYEEEAKRCAESAESENLRAGDAARQRSVHLTILAHAPSCHLHSDEGWRSHQPASAARWSPERGCGRDGKCSGRQLSS